MSDLTNSRLHQQMMALARIERHRRLRYWIHGTRIAALVFLSDQILKTYVLRQLAPGDQIQFFGQSYLVLTHLSTSLVSGSVLWLLEAALWVFVAAVLVLRAREAGQMELMASLTLLLAGLSNAVTRVLLGAGLNTFAIQSAHGAHVLTFNLSHVAVGIAAFFLTSSWLKALWPETFLESRELRT